MSDSIKCPVCGKVGIPDYHKDEVVCPCCGTDLSIYKMLADSQLVNTTQETSEKKWKIATAVSAALAILAFLFVFLPKEHELVEDTELKKQLEVLNDSINSLTNQLILANQEIVKLKIQPTASSDDIYIVRKNDSPCKISRNLYGTESRYKEIEAIITKPLQPGDTLKLK